MSSYLNVVLSNTKNDEWYTPQETVIKILDKLKLDKNLKIWCPCDTEESFFVKELSNRGYSVINSHSCSGKDFYEYEPKDYDVILTNPPFTNKNDFLKRLEELNKPFAILMSTNCFNNKGFNDTLSKLTDLKMIVFINRISYTPNYNTEYKTRCPFGSVLITNKIENIKNIDFI